MPVDRRRFLKATGALGAVGLAGCTTNPNNDAGDNNNNNTGNGDGDGGEDPVNVGMVYATGGLGDKSFNDMAHQGVQQAAKEYNVEYQNAEPEEASQVGSLQKRFAQEGTFDLITGVGFVQKDGMVTNAQEFPDQNWILIDETAQTEDGKLLENVANYRFKEHQGSFQIGYLSALLSTQEFSAGESSTKPDQKSVGFVGGFEIPLIKKFLAGFQAGVAHYDDSIEVQSAYAGAFNDPATGKEIALSMYDNGADIVYHAAGGTGLGVFQAARQVGGFAMGVDADQSKSNAEYKDVILASMVKHVDLAVYESVEAVVNGNFKGGVENRLGLKEEGVEAVYGQELGSAIPEDVKSKLEESKQQIIDGEITVPSEL
ncbi:MULTISPECIES: BMP family ABC transporter substrate-binding protein [unclassified Haladaptatus]|uniref:BMP family ABC transporter substrate-binding protein n=1 Tax=unclassified Haladaptatus TaxID=2622732 RepID=UPI0023E87AAB|nr:MULTISPECIES: BMP family ABC transporter substrate-binding protein [unclassified Haladaptatus]